jgi:hypothetical protein
MAASLLLGKLDLKRELLINNFCKKIQHDMPDISSELFKGQRANLLERHIGRFH